MDHRPPEWPTTRLADAYGADRRRHADGRPWFCLNMIASLDGAAAVDGVSGGLGGAADKAVFRALRGVADVVLVAAGTVRDEGYGPPRLDDEARAARRNRGQAEVPTLVIVTRSLDLDPAGALFVEAEERPIVLTVDNAPADARADLDRVAEVVPVGHDDVDLALAREALAERGFGVVLVEGGPSLNGQLAAADLFDEMCLTVAPLVVAGSAPRVVRGDGGVDPRRFHLDRGVMADGLLFCRYLRDR